MNENTINLSSNITQTQPPQDYWIQGENVFQLIQGRWQLVGTIGEFEISSQNVNKYYPLWLGLVVIIALIILFMVVQAILSRWSVCSVFLDKNLEYLHPSDQAS